MRDPGSVQLLESRQLLAADIQIGPSRVVLSDVRGGPAAVPYTITIRNKGNSALTLPEGAFYFGGRDRKNFVSFDDPSPLTIQPGGSTQIRLAMKATADAPLDKVLVATFNVKSNDPDTPIKVVSLRGIAMRSANGGTDEPSLQRIMDAYQIPINVGDPDANTPAIDNVNTSPDEIYAPRFVKAGTQPVYIDVLGSFSPTESNAKDSIGYYLSGQPDTKTELFEVNDADSQTLNPRTEGTRNFDPGSNVFSFYMEQASFQDAPLSGADGKTPRYAMGEDAYNQWETRSQYKRKFRVYPFNDGGTIVPNAYVVAGEEYGLDYPDHQDTVMIVYNVQPARSARSSA
ncbi:MAG: hypothetical protein QM770_05440 [Tepidisphaeraceae bacterium]